MLFKRKRREQLRAERERKRLEQEEEKETSDVAAASAPTMDIEAEGEESSKPSDEEKGEEDKEEGEKAAVDEMLGPETSAVEGGQLVVAAQKPQARALTPEEIEHLPSMMKLRDHMQVMEHLSTTLCDMLGTARVGPACPHLDLGKSSHSDSTGPETPRERMPNVVGHFQDILDLTLINGSLKEDFDRYIVLLAEYTQLLRAYHDNLDLDQLDVGLRKRLELLRFSTM